MFNTIFFTFFFRNFGGSFCKICAGGYYNYPECKACECNQLGSLNNDCDLVSGQCLCNINFDGKQCDRCKDGYFDYPHCSCEYFFGLL